MEITLLIAVFMFANAFFHVVQGFLYGFNKKNNPVVVWGLVLAALGVPWMSGNPDNWIIWVSLILPLIGVTALTFTLKQSTNTKWVDYSIIGLDVVTVAVIALTQL